MGRSIYCSKCRQEKELAVRNESQCKACKSERMKLSAIKKRIALGKPGTRPEREAYCEDCKGKKIQGISIGGRCNPCTVISNKIRLDKKRLLDGKEVVSIRDSSFCYVCNIPKVDGRCAACRQRMAKERKAKKRLEAGKRPWGEGRPLACYKCGEVKENPKASNCAACHSEYCKKRWAETIAPLVNQKEVTLICECGKTKESTRKFYCNDCLLFRKRKSTREAAQQRRDREKKQIIVKVPELLTENEKMIRQAARDYLNRLIRQNVVKRLNCEVCGSNKNVEAHHDDYTRPLDVLWLCRVHHDEHHKTND